MRRASSRMRSTPLLIEATPQDGYIASARFEDGTAGDVDLSYRDALRTRESPVHRSCIAGAHPVDCVRGSLPTPDYGQMKRPARSCGRTTRTSPSEVLRILERLEHPAVTCRCPPGGSAPRGDRFAPSGSRPAGSSTRHASSVRPTTRRPGPPSAAARPWERVRLVTSPSLAVRRL